ncbi:MAG: SDR family oxidoreductase [Bacteroidetes bacterium]|jgi:putative NADH-flavin reductase|nr:SDR family oxidoreductase [Bacteroidota bacterium]
MKIEHPNTALNILVIGANGGIGKQAVELALEAGHKVTALLRDPAKLAMTHANLLIAKGNVMYPESFEDYLEGKDAVISALGTNTINKPTILYSEGNKNLLKAMRKKGVMRAFFISASAIEISPVLPFYVRFAEKYIVQKILRHMYDDLRLMEKLIKETDTDWTIMRPPRLTDKPVTGKYRFAINSFLKNCLSISRADVAHFMINNINNEATYHTMIEISY